MKMSHQRHIQSLGLKKILRVWQKYRWIHIDHQKKVLPALIIVFFQTKNRLKAYPIILTRAKKVTELFQKKN